MTEDIRIHIGNISPSLVANSDSFTQRLTKFGIIRKPLEIYSKPTVDNHFGFITLNTTQSQYEKLRTTFHNVMYMGSKLSVSKAKDDFKEAWIKDIARIRPFKNKDKIHNERKQRIREAESSLHVNPITNDITSLHFSTGYNKSPHTFNNISGNIKNSAPTQTLIGSKSYGSWTNADKFYNMNYAKISGGSDIIRARRRKQVRNKTNLKNQTLRILVNGQLKEFKAYKTKLWGVEKNKTVEDLTWRYDNGVWKSGDDHIIEKLENTQSCSFDSNLVKNYGNDSYHSERDNIQPENDSTALGVLSNMLNNYDFEKPAVIDDDSEDEVFIDAKGRKTVVRYDYEANTNRDLGREHLEINRDIINKYKEGDIKEEVYYSESDEDETTLQQLENQEPKQEAKQELEKQELQNQKPKQDLENQDSKSNTETLRNLFNPSQPASFSLGLDSISEPVEPEKIELNRVDIGPSPNDIPTNNNNRGLFWIHQDSPFLQTQTQLSKLGFLHKTMKLPGDDEIVNPDDDETPYEQWFWKMRGDITRECKRRKRDVVRTLNKKSARNVTI